MWPDLWRGGERTRQAEGLGCPLEKEAGAFLAASPMPSGNSAQPRSCSLYLGRSVLISLSSAGSEGKEREREREIKALQCLLSSEFMEQLSAVWL